MTRVRSYPYRRPRATRIGGVTWYDPQQPDQPLAPLLAHWDPSVSVAAGVRADLDLTAVYADCALPPDAALRFAVTWRSAGTGLRGRGAHVDLTAAEGRRSLDLSVRVRGADISERLKLEAVLTLLDPGTPTDLLAPMLPGSVLWNEEHSILLEGQAARFPVDVVDFSSVMQLPSNAAWYLDWPGGDLHAPAMGGLCLLVNSRHAAVRRAVDGVSIPGTVERAVWSAAAFDIHRQLITAALRDEHFVRTPHAFEEGSVGAFIRRRCRSLFPQETFSYLRTLALDQTAEFEAELQARLKTFHAE